MDPGQIEALVENKIQDVMRANNADLLTSITGMFNKISSASTSQSHTVLDVPKFKRKSNEEQYKVNSNVLMKLEALDSALQSGSIESAKESLIEARDVLKRRQKLVQLADMSDLGWRTVSEYVTNPIASDSDDEKRIFKAEARASRKAKSEKAKSKRFQPYRRYSAVPAVADAQVGSTSVQKPKPGLCFQCGKPGHWKKECTVQVSSQSNNKISTGYGLQIITL